VGVWCVGGGWVTVSSPEYTRMKKKPCKRWFTGLVVIYMCLFVSLHNLSLVCRPSRVVRGGGVSRREIETKKTEN